jgi:hypothetical protein
LRSMTTPEKTTGRLSETCRKTKNCQNIDLDDRAPNLSFRLCPGDKAARQKKEKN